MYMMHVIERGSRGRDRMREDRGREKGVGGGGGNVCFDVVYCVRESASINNTMYSVG